ncbi:hypothetical protein HYW42_01605 [Candidatus Daviesbacteria bacterium]|nr:hypothetical protein [Candidatus Daviesbacteria bacterium]
MGLNTVESDTSAVRNSGYRSLAGFLNPIVEKGQARFPGVKAWHITATGIALTIAGTELEEYQNRRGKHTTSLDLLSGALTVLGVVCDLLDGKWARLARSEMWDPVKREDNEKWGQAIDPAADGVIEAHRAFAGAVTAWHLGDKEGFNAAMRNMESTNRPRTAKAFVGAFGKATPESYPVFDPRFLGTSLGRKVPNFLSTYVRKLRGCPIQFMMDSRVANANDVVTAERLWMVVKPAKRLNGKEAKHAQARLVVLGAETLAIAGAAYLVRKTLTFPENK